MLLPSANKTIFFTIIWRTPTGFCPTCFISTCWCCTCLISATSFRTCLRSTSTRRTIFPYIEFSRCCSFISRIIITCYSFRYSIRWTGYFLTRRCLIIYSTSSTICTFTINCYSTAIVMWPWWCRIIYSRCYFVDLKRCFTFLCQSCIISYLPCYGRIICILFSILLCGSADRIAFDSTRTIILSIFRPFDSNITSIPIIVSGTSTSC